MHILFLTSRFPKTHDHFTLEKELVHAFATDGHQCTVANILEKKNGKSSFLETLHNPAIKSAVTSLSRDNVNISSVSTASNAKLDAGFDIDLLNIKTGNLFNNVSFFEKKITVLSLAYLVPKTIKQFLANHHFDCIIAYGPYLSSVNIVKPLKRFFNCDAILVQWDIFPQNAFDLGIIKNKLLLKFFVHKQRNQLKNYDLIICNSQGNINYFAQKFPAETAEKLYLFHNCESPLEIKPNITIETHVANQAHQVHTNVTEHAPVEKNPSIADDSSTKFYPFSSTRAKYNLAPDDVLLMFGGNIGIPQALENIVFLADSLSHNKKIHFIISGQGTEAKKIKNLCAKRTNVTFIDFLPSKEYEKLLAACDYGVISLSDKFTVPNFPAKVTSYLKLGIPVFACVDDTASQDLGHFINSNNIGLSINAKNYKKSIPHIEEFLMDSELRKLQSSQALKIFDQYFNIRNTYAKLIKRISLVNATNLSV